MKFLLLALNFENHNTLSFFPHNRFSNQQDYKCSSSHIFLNQIVNTLDSVGTPEFKKPCRKCWFSPHTWKVFTLIIKAKQIKDNWNCSSLCYLLIFNFINTHLDQCLRLRTMLEAQYQEMTATRITPFLCLLWGPIANYLELDVSSAIIASV